MAFTPRKTSENLAGRVGRWSALPRRPACLRRTRSASSRAPCPMPWCEPRPRGKAHGNHRRRPDAVDRPVNPSPTAAPVRTSDWVFRIAAIAVALVNVFLFVPVAMAQDEETVGRVAYLVGVAVGCLALAALVYGVTRLLRRGTLGETAV